ncbi:hypothetical protein DCS_01690 [Drechmeria coniospora]|uniref:FAR1 domain-containing protein n=1 Tax=Drechmeria coniospora TaxID=98403 RepID=A0A151GU18_DRECN|nr:hypothetical protein DCS_01690 [Drechmeria coniospora]KYK60553.1 hypothetical protein DCS_01690 [Drechmeria coniospora]
MDLNLIINVADDEASRNDTVHRVSSQEPSGKSSCSEASSEASSETSSDDANDTPTIPTPPTPGVFDSYEKVYDFLQSFHRNNGAGIIKRTSGRTRHDFGQGEQPTRIVFICDRGLRYISKSTGLRKVTSQRTGCPYSITAFATQKMEWKWSYRVTNGSHNHGPSRDPSAHNIHRRRTKEQKEIQQIISKSIGTAARDMDSIIREQSEQVYTYFRIRDIYNDRQRIKKDLRRDRSTS